MIPLDALKALGGAVGAAVTIYNVIHEQRRIRPTEPAARLEVEMMDARCLAILRELHGA